jgi:site-specific DNA-methyltransferase (adenine-specific)
MIDLRLGDCLEIMPLLKNQSIDLVLTDPPYGTTSCKWDSVIPFEPMWEQLKRIIKDRGAVLLFGTEPFSSQLRLSNLKMYKYDWIWHKSKSGSAFTSKFRPQSKHEIISVFGKGKVEYYPQMRVGDPYYRKRKSNKDGSKPNNHKLGVVSESETVNTGFRYPETVIYFQQKWRRQDQLHPTQKPVELLEYLINTYTQTGNTVLDFTMGSGSTGVACKNLGRNFIGMEINEKYFEIAKRRINQTTENLL